MGWDANVLLVATIDCGTFASDRNDAARIVGGRADANGFWEYGRLEVFGGGVWAMINEQPEPRQQLGRRGAQVACRSLGYSTGAQLLVGMSSPQTRSPASFTAPSHATDLKRAWRNAIPHGPFLTI